MNSKVVYTYRDPEEELPFYVGQGSLDRPYQHLMLCYRLKIHSHFYHKLNRILAEERSPIIEIVADGLTNQQAIDLEIQLIKIYGRKDTGTGCLCNHTDGGKGTLGHSMLYKEVSVDSRIKMSKPRSKQAIKNSRQGKRIMSGVSIESFNLKTGELIKKYECQSDVALEGLSKTAVSNVLTGRSKSSAGFGWRYAQ